MSPPRIYDVSGSRADIDRLQRELASVRTLEHVLAWTRGSSPPLRVAEIVTQDEYTHDVLVPLNDGYLAFDTT